jgi:hypothetical protein
VPPTSFEVPHSLLSLFLQHLSWGSTDVPVLRVEVTRAREVIVVAEATRVAVVLAVKTS